ncbi:hypothetical protein EFD55_26085 [Rhizobium pisi]|uniref:Uncharacterized protein n=1 Tax=Rhizobium pisi TaxID=574561 RepID=A0A427MDI1_9HYPH|nr:hypothetical protein EFD55_26085 [Rhizobium pisi]TCA47755.1 hypothetical protein E0J16_27385 [Rhizobium pisi]
MTHRASSLIPRCPEGASKDEAGAPAINACRGQRWSACFEAPPSRAAHLSMRDAGEYRAHQ